MRVWGKMAKRRKPLILSGMAAILSAALQGVSPTASVADVASTPDFAAFEGCVAGVEDVTAGSSFHRCTGALAAHCGASATAADAVACIGAVRDDVEARIEAGVDAFADRSGDEREEIEWYLSDGRGSGESSCAVMASQDAATGVAVGQRAVNGAFCELIVSGDVYALLLRLEGAE